MLDWKFRGSEPYLEAERRTRFMSARTDRKLNNGVRQAHQAIDGGRCDQRDRRNGQCPRTMKESGTFQACLLATIISWVIGVLRWCRCVPLQPDYWDFLPLGHPPIIDRCRSSMIGCCLHPGGLDSCQVASSSLLARFIR